MTANTLEEAIFEKLLADVDVTAIVGEGADARIYPMILPQSVQFPAVHFSRISADRTYSMDGKTGLSGARFQFESYSEKTPEEVKSLSEAIRRSLEVFQGTVGNVVINGIFLEFDSSLDNFDDRTDLFRYTQDFIIHHQEN